MRRPSKVSTHGTEKPFAAIEFSKSTRSPVGTKSAVNCSHSAEKMAGPKRKIAAAFAGTKPPLTRQG